MLITLSLKNYKMSLTDCLRENKEKYKTFSFPIKTEIEKIEKDGNETVETVSYKIRFTDSANLWQVDHQILLII